MSKKRKPHKAYRPTPKAALIKRCLDRQHDILAQNNRMTKEEIDGIEAKHIEALKALATPEGATPQHMGWLLGATALVRKRINQGDYPEADIPTMLATMATQAILHRQDRIGRFEATKAELLDLENFLPISRAVFESSVFKELRVVAAELKTEVIRG